MNAKQCNRMQCNEVQCNRMQCARKTATGCMMSLIMQQIAMQSDAINGLQAFNWYRLPIRATVALHPATQDTNTMISYSECFERWTADDIEAGETHDLGFADQDASDNFRGMVDLLQFCEPNQQPITSPDTIWFTHYDYNNGTREYYEDGITETRSYHPTTARDARYMIKAWSVNN